MFVKTKLIQNHKDRHKPGLITTRLTYNNIIDSNYRLWFLSNAAGNALFYIQLEGTDSGCTVAFTEEDIALRYINSDLVRKILLKSFGLSVVLSNMSLFYIQKILNPMNANFLNTVAVNPNNSDNFFVPLQLSYFRGIYDSLEDESMIVDAHKQSSIFLNYDTDLLGYKIINRTDHESDSFGLFGMGPDIDDDDDDEDGNLNDINNF
jgi:hypothetical protein